MQQGTIATDRQPRSAPVVNAPLPSGYHYNGPLVSTATPCKCSTVYYSVISACATCQDGQYLTSVFFSFIVMRYWRADGLACLDGLNGTRIAPRFSLRT